VTRLPAVLRAWSRIGRRIPIAARLRVTRWLCRLLVSSGETYAATGGFAFSIDPEDPFQGTMLVGLYDPVAEAILRLYTPVGATVIDGGAHLGYFSLRLGRWVGPTGQVHAFECDPRLLPRLRRHLDLNGLHWVTMNPLGLSDRLGEQRLYLPGQLGWASTLTGAWGARDTATVEMTTLDDYVAQTGLAAGRISLIKLDLEGSELRALHGGRRTLAATSAAVLVELIPGRMRAAGQDPAELLALMAGLGFAPFSPVRVSRRRLGLVAGAEPAIGEDVLFLKRSH